jgi:hypothetical protein
MDRKDTRDRTIDPGTDQHVPREWEVHTQIEADGTVTTTIPAFTVDQGKLLKHPGNAVRMIPPNMRDAFGLDGVRSSTTWDDLEAIALQQGPVFGHEQEWACSEWTLDPQVHQYFFYGRAVAGLHAKGWLPRDNGPDNWLFDWEHRIPVVIDPGPLHLRPVRPAFMATHFPELVAAYSEPTHINALLCGYLKTAHLLLDPIHPGFTSELVGLLGGLPVSLPRPRRVVNISHAMGRLGLTATHDTGLFDIGPPNQEKCSFADALTLTTALLSFGASLRGIAPVIGHRTSSTPVGDWIEAIQEQRLANLLVASSTERYLVVLATAAERLAPGLAGDSRWQDSWSELPANPIKGVMRTTLENETTSVRIAVVDRICDAIIQIIAELSVDGDNPNWKKARSDLMQTCWTIAQLALGSTPINDARLARLECYDHALGLDNADPEPDANAFLSWAFAKMSRNNFRVMIFEESVRAFSENELSCPLYSAGWDAYSSALRILRIGSAVSFSINAHAGVQVLTGMCLSMLARICQRMRLAMKIGATRGVAPCYGDQGDVLVVGAWALEALGLFTEGAAVNWSAILHAGAEHHERFA